MANPVSLGGVKEDEIEALASESPGPPTDAGASTLTRFIRKLADLVVLREANGEDDEIAIFLQSSALVDDLAKVASVEVPLLTNGNDPVSGRVWLSTARVGTAHSLSLDDVEEQSPAGLYEFVRSCNLGTLPAFVVDFRGATPTARVYPNGIVADRMDDYHLVDLADRPIAPDVMKAALDSFYAKSLRTPALVVEGHAQRVWKNAVKGWPEYKPEERIHGRLMDALRARFTRHEVRAELITDEGRVDIVVWTPTADASGVGAMRFDWALELKALTDRTTNGSVVAPSSTASKIVEGLSQVMAYRKKINAQQAALCCFDLRVSDSGDTHCFAAISKQAESEEIYLWRWFLFRSTSKARAVSSPVNRD